MSTNQNDYNKPGLITFVMSMGVSLVFLVYVAFFTGGVDLREVRDKSPDQGVPQTQAAAEKAVDVNTIKEPWVESEQLIAGGKQIYSQNCAMCHGAAGGGDGVAGASLNPKPRNLVEGKWKYGGDRLGLMHVLEVGSPGTSMQSYKDSLKVNQRWALVHFIRSITKNKVADDDAKVAAKAPTLK